MIINLLATWIPALLIALLGVLKLTGNPRVADELSKLGVGRYLRLLGVMEIAFAALFVLPATMKLGFILASCYFAGAVATELSRNALNGSFKPKIKSGGQVPGDVVDNHQRQGAFNSSVRRKIHPCPIPAVFRMPDL
jgi:DoxX-like protein